MSENNYQTPDRESTITSSELQKLDRDMQLEIMRAWFYQNFEDPAERTPYESAEGGYIWIWGGPYDAREELEDEFSEIVSDDLINELAEDLTGESWEWAPTPSASDYDDYLIDDIAQISEYYHNFSGAILDIEKLLEGKVDSTVATCLYRLLYVNVITALETYLSDAFISTVATNPLLMRKFIETTPDFQNEKIPLADVFKAWEEIEQKARSYLIDVVWHNLGRVKPMYRDTLGIDFPNDVGTIFRAILKRHDIVHRNGKTKEGDEIIVVEKDVRELIHAAELFIQEIDSKFSNKNGDEF